MITIFEIIILEIIIFIGLSIIYVYCKKIINEQDYRVLILEKRINDGREDTYLLFKKLYDRIIDYEARIEKLERKINRMRK